MAEFKPAQFEKKENKSSIDFLADEVARKIKVLKGKYRYPELFHKACAQVFSDNGIEDIGRQLELKSKIGTVLSKRAHSQSKKNEQAAQPVVPALPNSRFWQEIEDQRIENLKNSAPLFADQIEREERRHFD